MLHLTSHVILSLGTGFCVLQIPLQSPCPQANPSVTPALYCLALSASQGESPSTQTITGKALRNQLATAGRAAEVVHLFSSYTGKGISFVLSWPKNAFKHTRRSSLQMASGPRVVINLNFISRLEKPVFTVTFLKAHLLQRCWQERGGRENSVICFYQEASDHVPWSRCPF